MSESIVLEARVERSYGARGRIELRRPQKDESVEVVRRPALVAVQLALAHTWAVAVARGKYESFGALAAELNLTRARVSQLMDLTLLAPDLQEQVLFWEAIDGQEPMGEARVRRVLKEGSWSAQREAWCQMLAQGDRRRSEVRQRDAR